MNQLPDNQQLTPAARFLRTLAFATSLGLIMVIPGEGAVFIDGIGRLSRIMGLLTGAVWCLSVVASGQIRKPQSFHLIVGLFLSWNVLSVLWTIDSGRTLERSKTCVQIGVMILILWDLYVTPRAIRFGLQAFVLGTYGAAMGTVSSFMRSDAYFHGRFAAGGLHVDDLGLMLALGLPGAWYLFLHGPTGRLRNNFLRLLNVSYIPIAILAIFLTGTRGAVVASVPTALYMISSLSKFGPTLRLCVGGVGIISCSLVMTFIPVSSFERLGTIGEEITEGDLNGRTNIWRTGFMKINDHPFLGIGSSCFPVIPENREGHVAHNTFLSVLFELGLVGFGLLVLVSIIVFQAVWHHPTQERWFWMTLLAVLALGVSTLTWEHRKPLWLIMTLITCSSALYPVYKYNFMTSRVKVSEPSIAFGRRKEQEGLING